MKLKKGFLGLAVLVLWSLAGCQLQEEEGVSDTDVAITDENIVKIGYFHGGRVNMIYRTHINSFFDEEGINVKLYTQNLKSTNLFEVPKSNVEVRMMAEAGSFGKIRGTEIVELMLEGVVDGGTIGEGSFIRMVNDGAPIVAVALLGYENTPGLAIVMRKGIAINSVDDFRGLTLLSRRSGPGGTIFLKEFFEEIGFASEDLNVINAYGNNSKDWQSKKKEDYVNVIYQVDEDDSRNWFIDGSIDGGLYHFSTVRILVHEDAGYIYRPMDWMKPDVSHAVLVFNKDYVQNHPEEVQKVVTAYVKRVKYEKDLPENEKDRSWDKGLFMENNFQGLAIPRYDFPPKIRINPLNEMQDLQLKYGYIEEKINIEEFIDDSFVDKAVESMNIVSNETDFKNVILIGWDGVERERLNKLLADNKLPGFTKYFLQQGSCVNTTITTGTTQTKPGWAEILTGYSSSKTGVFSNLNYRPIPKGYTIFERLEEYFGSENIVTLFIAGKINNLAARGPHKICINCLHRDFMKGGAKFKYWDENSGELFPVGEEEPILEQREGEPYFITEDYIDVYVNALGESSNVKEKSFSYLDEHHNKKFFMFLHYEEPDEQGHRYNEDSPEYEEAIIQNDVLLEELVFKLKQLGILDKTRLFLTTDHSFDVGSRGHHMAEETFFCSSEKNLNQKTSGDRKDVTPTILDMYGFDLETIEPHLDGISLVKK